MKLLRKAQRDDPNDKGLKRIPHRTLAAVDSDGDGDESNGRLRRITSLLKLLSTARGVVPALVFFAILFALILASTLLSGAVQMEDHKPQLQSAVRPVITKAPAVVTKGATPRPTSAVTSAPSQQASNRLPDESDQRHQGDGNVTLEEDQKYANAKRDREDEEVDHNAGHKVIAVVEKKVPGDGSSEASNAPREMRLQRSSRFDLRGLHTIPYRLARNGKELPREARAFPMLKGVFVMTLMLPSQPNGSNKSAFSAHSAPSQFGCICVDNGTIANSTQSVIDALQAYLPVKATEAIVQRNDDAVELSLDASTLLYENRDIVEHIKHEILKSGRMIVQLANQTQALATRSLPCAVRFYGSTAIGLCDPMLNNSFTDADVVPEDVEEDEETHQKEKSKKKKKKVRNAMIPVGSCGMLDFEIAREAVKRRIANIPANEVITHRIKGGKDALVDVLLESFGWLPQNRTANLTAEQQQQQPGNRKLLSLQGAEPSRHIFFDEQHEREEMSAMCDMCGSTTSAEGNVFANTAGQTFTKIFFKKADNLETLTALKNMSKSRWKAVGDLFRDMQHPQHEGGVIVPIGTANITEHFLDWLAMGFREMEAYSKRCDKKKFTEHYAQCFKAAVPTSQQQYRGWSGVAKEFTSSAGSHLDGHQLRPSRFLSYDVDKHLFPIPSRLIFHPLSAGGHLACYATGDMVCDIVGRSGGWELELIHIVAYAAQALRRETRRAAALLKSRLQGCLQRKQADDPSLTNGTAMGHLEKFEKKYGTTDNGLLVDEFSISPSINGNTAPMRYNIDDVVFLDVGGNVGVFAVSMWKRGFRTEVFEALPQNVFLLESAACTNQAEELAMWEEQRSQRLAQHIRRIEKNITADMKNESEIAAVLKEARPRLLAAAIQVLPKWLRYPGEDADSKGSRGMLHGPQLLPFNIHHTALGNGRKGRSGGDESLSKEGGSNLTADAIHRIAMHLLKQITDAALLANRGNGTEGNNVTSASECVMISEQANFGDIVILCNETLVAEAKEALAAAVGSKERSRVRVLKNYIPRGFVELNSLDNYLFPKDEPHLIDFNFTTMRTRFADVFAATLVDGGFPSDEKCDVKRKKALFEDRASKDKHFAQHAVDDYNTTSELIEFLSFSHSVMKIDVEGQEEFVMQGADLLLSNKSIRPKLILSEVWRKTAIGRYGALMVGRHGYSGFALADSMWLRTVEDVVAYHAGMPREMDTIVWVAAGYEFLLPPMVLQKPPA